MGEILETLGTLSVDHRLTLNVLQLGIAPPMDDLYGKAEFTAEEIGAMRRALDECGVRDMPAFRKVTVSKLEECLPIG